MEKNRIKKLLVANRGEIAIRVFRAAYELDIKTVGVFTYEDRYSLHRYKSDESYQIGNDQDALKPYLSIDTIIDLAKKAEVDAIHPGYGFLSENIDFVTRCEEEGIIFVGPSKEAMSLLGDKLSAKKIADSLHIPIIQNNIVPVSSMATALAEAIRIKFPVMIKAVAGGGGRGMRVVFHEKEFEKLFQEAKKEAKNAFGNDTIFIEKYIENPKHIEVQIMADHYGNIVHLYERDCSVQRRFQKMVEVAPCITIKEKTRKKLFDFALELCTSVGYKNVGTVEFLVDKDENIYFIEVNPRVQVEHTITEEITGIDIVRSQLLIAQGHALHEKELNIPLQPAIHCHGVAIQCRITTEDPKNEFKPHFGTVIEYRNAGGFGIRIDEGSIYSNMRISPFFDSMIAKVSSWGRTLTDASLRLQRTLREFRVRGVKTNIGFLQNVLKDKTFLSGNCHVKFIDTHPQLLNFEPFEDSATKALSYIGEVIINGNPDIKNMEVNKTFQIPKIPTFSGEYPKGTQDRLERMGRDKFVQWLKQEKKIHFTDTTFRDAHQSLLATRIRTIDLLAVSESFAKNHADIFSMEVWGGATFDVCLRFLKEDPWKRLQMIKKAIPNILLQMLLRGSNAVGYKSYPKNVVETFICKAAENGISLFRIFDSFNNIDSMKLSIETVLKKTNSLAEVAICYTGDILSKHEKKYTLDYYLRLAREIEDQGAHILAIKDMAGLLKPLAAKKLIEALKNVIHIPIHLHTHDTSSIQAATYLQAIDAGVNVVDVAISSLSGLTSQPSLNSIIEMVRDHERQNPIDIKKLNEFSNYWENVREYYYSFETELRSGTAEVYFHEIPGGQYSNLKPQARSLGLEEKFDQIKYNYQQANELLGNIVKVTPSSKVVGDLAMFMTSSHLTKEDILQQGDTLTFPESLLQMLQGDLGTPSSGFPKELTEKILKNNKTTKEPPEDIDMEKEMDLFYQKYGKNFTELDFLSYQLYPSVFEEYVTFHKKYGNVWQLPTLTFFYGLKIGEEILLEIKKGKLIIIKLLFFSQPDEMGQVTVFFVLNGKNRQIQVKDISYKTEEKKNKKVDTEDVSQIGTPLHGKISDMFVRRGDAVEEGTPLFVIEAMKMETTITSSKFSKIKKIVLKKGSWVEQGDLILLLDT